MTHGERLIQATRRRVYHRVGKEMQRVVRQARSTADEEVRAMRKAGFERYQEVRADSVGHNVVCVADVEWVATGDESFAA